jgi:hypothetical protein
MRRIRSIEGEVTLILEALSRGERQATGELLPLVYNELRRLAAQQLARLGITVYRARQKWTYARAWLRDALGD